MLTDRTLILSDIIIYRLPFNLYPAFFVNLLTIMMTSICIVHLETLKDLPWLLLSLTNIATDNEK